MSDKIREEFENIYKHEDNCDMNFEMNKDNSKYVCEYTEDGFQFFKDGHIYPKKEIKKLRDALEDCYAVEQDVAQVRKIVDKVFKELLE